MKKLILFLCMVVYCEMLLTIPFSNPNEMLQFVKKILPENPIILEAGGHYGEDTIRMKSVWSGAFMYVFEPFPSSFKKILKNTKHLSNIMCYPCALTSYTGKTSFHVDPGNDGASSIGSPVAWNQHEFDKKIIEVPCTTLNDWSKQNNISHIDFMWLDMEGNELYALQHASNILANVRAIYTEVNFVSIRVNACLYQDVKNFLESQGFYEAGKFCSSHIQGDCLFIRK